ncbi:hypothetical protein AB6A40_000181 [Gnathostoma spinigerum]|uniref:Transcription factor Dp-1 n=1 Tax=Gnathostoma spinigerum TaxID=75299 RepID=A0ABD6E9W5_9BILA
MDAHASQKLQSGVVVQLVRPSSASTSVHPSYPVDVTSSQGQRYVMNANPNVKRIALQTAAPTTMTARSIVTTAVQPRFAASSRLGTPQIPTASTQVYGLKRPFTHTYSHEFITARKYPRSADKSKGLRHFSTKVCEKVKEKGQTNYNEVADELVAEYFDSLSNPPGDTEKQQYDMKNIRRRVYDALNVLMAMNIIEKEKKEIRWVGLPTSSLQECRRLEEEKAKRQERIQQKMEQLQELIIQLVAYKSLIEKNRERERTQGRPMENTVIYLPYIVINTEKSTMIDCAISHDKSEYLFNFDNPFEIHDDIEILKRLGLAHGLERGEMSPEMRLQVKSYLPVALRDYVDQILEGKLCGNMLVANSKAQQAQTVNIVSGNAADRKSIITSYSSAPVMRAVVAQSSGGRTYGTTTANYSNSLRYPQARYAVVPKVIGQPATKYGNGVAYRTSSGSGRQYIVQGTPPQRAYSGPSQNRVQSVTYTIQAPAQNQMVMQGQRYEEVYEDEEENLHYE